MAVDVLAPFAALLNRTIGASTPARELLRRLEGRAFAIQVETPIGGRLVRLHLKAGAAGLTLAANDVAADATVTGSPLALAALLADRAAGRTSSAGVSIAGNAEVAESFERLLRHARPDLEEELARLVGDTPGYYLAQGVRNLAGWAGRARESFARNVGEYLTEEGRDLVARAELEVFLGSVDRLRDDTERAGARLTLLEQRARARSARS